MAIWGYTLEAPLDWAAFVCAVAVAAILFFVLLYFVQRMSTGIFGGFVMLLAGLGMVLAPAYILIFEDNALPMMIVYGATIFCGCVALLVGTFSLMDFSDF